MNLDDIITKIKEKFKYMEENLKKMEEKNKQYEEQIENLKKLEDKNKRLEEKNVQYEQLIEQLKNHVYKELTNRRIELEQRDKKFNEDLMYLFNC